MKVISSTQMANMESKAISEGSLDTEFMEEAGVNIARLVHSFIERNDLQKQVILLCGKGNNAGDAYTAGIHLLNMDYSVDAFQLFPFKECSPLCQMNQTKFFNLGGLIREVNFLDEFALPLNGLIVDGIFGTGFKGEIKEPISSIIFKANHSKLPIISIDIPSGLNGDTGKASKETIHAKETAFLGLPKIGFFLNEGWNCLGKLRYVDFGLPEKYIAEAKTDFKMLDLSLVKQFLPPIKRNRNKYEAGFVVGLAGSKGMTG
ncbi:MAG TPA: NAD(P)H-hydrate epimerase, partial [Parachlamydiaceae bacterium]|nr:NAD(P)H-hydrate epimerase [Parachlamydiaceae bacterium]